jgi:hypothetical protein
MGANPIMGVEPPSETHLGKGGAKRHRKVLRDCILGITMNRRQEQNNRPPGLTTREHTPEACGARVSTERQVTVAVAARRRLGLAEH